MEPMAPRSPLPTSPIAWGAVLAVAAAALFGMTTPLVGHFGRGVGPWTTAAILYVGAALGAGVRVGRIGKEPPLGRSQLVRATLVATLGAALAPASLAWGLQHGSALSGSLVLNAEAPMTLLLAWLVYREPVGRRVGVAVALMAVGGGILAARQSAEGASGVLGLLAILGATLCWALDNTLTRPLADFDPTTDVLAKALVGALLSGGAAIALREAAPHRASGLGLLACGVVGYGLSLRLYLRAQRVLGVGRTGSLFALAPFVGAALAFAMGDRGHVAFIAAAAALFAVAVYLHVTEDHGHVHHHEALEHEHAHRHDDGHHEHPHDLDVSEAHSHRHRHEAIAHDHPHGVDLHHRHRHRSPGRRVSARRVRRCPPVR